MVVKLLTKRLLFVISSLFNPHQLVFLEGIYFRYWVTRLLSQAKDIKTNFIIRRSYSGHINTIKGNVEQVRLDFVDNIRQSDYVLCAKGDGNFSYRFYETLSLGRLPLFVDTDCVLPLENLIDYRRFCLFVDYRELSKIAERVSGHYRSITEDDYRKLQNEARQAFENYLRVDKFTPYLCAEIRRRLSINL